MNFAGLSALDRRILITAGIAAIAAVLSFVDSSGSWGPVMVLALLGAILGVFVAVQPQVAPGVKLPVTKGLSTLIAGAVATGGFALAMLNYIGYISRNLLDPFVIVMIVGLVASIVLLFTGWQAYQAEPKAAAAAPAPQAAAPAPPPADTPETPSA